MVRITNDVCSRVINDVYGLGRPIRKYLQRLREPIANGPIRGSTYPDLFSVCRVAIWDEYWLALPDNSNGLLEEITARQCPDKEKLFLGCSKLREPGMGMWFQGEASEERQEQLEKFMVRAFGHSGVEDQAKAILRTNPLIYLRGDSIGLLSEIIEKYQKQYFAKQSYAQTQFQNHQDSL